MDVARRDEGMDARTARRLDGLDRALDVLRPRAREAADDRRLGRVPTVRPGSQRAAVRCVLPDGLGHALQVVGGQSHTVLPACDVTLIASGTATLEAALFKRPMVIGYRMHALSWRLMRRKQLQPWVGLPNILCGDFVVPELIQDAATPQALAAAVLQWFDARQHDPQRLAALQERFTALHHSLLRNTPQLAAEAIRKVIYD